MVPQDSTEHLVRMVTTALLEPRENLEMLVVPVPLDSMAHPEHEDLMELLVPLASVVKLDQPDPPV